MVEMVIRFLLRLMPWYDPIEATVRAERSDARQREAIEALESYRRARKRA